MKKEVMSPNTKRFQDYFLSRLLKKFPFLVEAWYWALIYWVSKLASLVLFICRDADFLSGVPTRSRILGSNNGRRHR